VKIIAGLTNASRGEVLFKGENITIPGRDRTVVFQDHALFAWKTCKENIEFALRCSGLNGDTRTRSAKAMYIIEEWGLGAFADEYPFALSGGMKQRLAMARALAATPDLLLMDEPFASLDPQTRELSQEELMNGLAARGVTVLIVTHDLNEAVFVADRILVVSTRPGTIAATLRVDLPRPRTAETRFDPAFTEKCRELWMALQQAVSTINIPIQDYPLKESRDESTHNLPR
jgi:NitT/TauT family transport system ATP-binding protein